MEEQSLNHLVRDEMNQRGENAIVTLPDVKIDRKIATRREKRAVQSRRRQSEKCMTVRVDCVEGNNVHTRRWGILV
jgi:hypothetical protein